MEMQKVQNVSKIVFFILLLSMSNSIFSQKTLEGRFVNNTNWYQFHTDNTFDYADVGELGTERYGKGHYLLSKDTLKLNYDLTEIKCPGYHIMRTYQNLKDSIDIKLNIYDFNKKPLPNTKVLLFKGNGKDSGMADIDGKVRLTVEKNNEASTYLMFYYNDTMYRIPEIDLYLSYEIDIFLSKVPFIEPFERGYAIKDAVQKYRVKKSKKDYLELQQPNGTILKLKKVEKGFYGNDPFE
ncbi:hypothetical protein CAPN004_12310 [Capnocytophaga cynodegmi]|nr:hypothetical protein CAPN004_12310 [Capnocytophaga cynodegmi]